MANGGRFLAAFFIYQPIIVILLRPSTARSLTMSFSIFFLSVDRDLHFIDVKPFPCGRLGVEAHNADVHLRDRCRKYP